uniref:Uncharacterized protein n=1 Tax=Oryza barthii TaxID=65489 RepID=A0A0D3EMQ8_9ORYZ
MVSAFLTVLKRCATMTVVLLVMTLSRASCTILSDSASRALVASSSKLLLLWQFFASAHQKAESHVHQLKYQGPVNIGKEKEEISDWFLADKANFTSDPPKLEFLEIHTIYENITKLRVVKPFD